MASVRLQFGDELFCRIHPGVDNRPRPVRPGDLCNEWRLCSQQRLELNVFDSLAELLRQAHELNPEP
jgi:hypothetical protein